MKHIFNIDVSVIQVLFLAVKTLIIAQISQNLITQLKKVNQS
jgi:hypothetical protein